MSDASVSWLSGVAPAVQTALLADHRGGLPPDVMARMPSCVHKTYWKNNPAGGNCTLGMLQLSAQRGRKLDDWWHWLPANSRAALLEHRGGLVPNEHLTGVGSLDQLGAQSPPTPRRLNRSQTPPLVTTYLGLRATQGEA